MADGVPIQIAPDDWGVVQAILREHVPGRDVWAFGSRAKGTAKPFSDLDLAIGGDVPMTLAEQAALAEAFEESSLSYRVDVVELAAISASFRDCIERDLVLVRRAES